MEKIIENLLKTLEVQRECMDVMSNRIDMANKRIDNLKEVVETQGNLLMVISKRIKS